MTVLKRISLTLTTLVLTCVVGSLAVAQYAASVASYSPGTTPASGFTTPSAALGSPERFTGEGVFPSVVSPFNPPFLSSEIVSVGEGGQLTLRLSNYAVPQPAGPEIGLFSNVGLIDVNYPFGEAGSPAGTFGPPDSALVEVSANGTAWVSLGNVTLDVPTNGYTDLTDPFAGAPGSVPSDFQRPFTGSLSSFDGLKYFDAGGPDMLDWLAGSGGGKWLDMSGTGLAQVGFIRFSLADDGNSSTKLNFEIDGVAISHAALGVAVVPEPVNIMSCGLAVWVLAAAVRRRTTDVERSRPIPTTNKVRSPGSG